MIDINKIKTVLLLLLLIGFASCNMDVDNNLIVIEEDSFKNENDVNALMLGAYAQMQELAPQLVLLNEARADYLELTSAGSADLDLLALHQNNVAKENSYVSVKPFYKIIQTCNNIIANVPKVGASDPAFTKEVENHYLAEATGLRSWTYFQLAKLYGSVNYYESYVSSSQDRVMGETLSLEQLVPKLIDTETAHLNNFSANFIRNYSAAWRRVRFSEHSTLAFLGELHMFNAAIKQGDAPDDYKKALKHLGALMSLDSTTTSRQTFKVGNLYGGDKWSDIYKNMVVNADEAIFAVDYSKTYKQQHSLQDVFNDNPLLLFNYGYENIWESVDKRAGISVDFSSRQVRKFKMQKQALDNDAPIIFYRAADIHLLYAEALNSLGRTAEALDIVNKGNAYVEYTSTGEKKYNAQSLGVRGRQNLPEFVIVASEAEMPGIVAELIRKERMRELAFEGKYWQDKIRYALLKGETFFKNGEEIVSKDKWFLPQ